MMESFKKEVEERIAANPNDKNALADALIANLDNQSN